MNPSDPWSRLAAAGVVATVTFDDPAAAVPLAETLATAGIQAMEITLRSDAGLEAIRRVAGAMPAMLVVAGTVLTPEQARQARDAGAAAAVAPGCNPRTIRAARDLGLPFGPGVATASEIEIALEHECRLLKFFPAETAGGLRHLAVLAAPFEHLGPRYFPLGGIQQANLAQYLASPLVAAVGGSWLAPRDLIRAGSWPEIAARAAAAAATVRAVRNASGIVTP